MLPVSSFQDNRHITDSQGNVTPEDNDLQSQWINENFINLEIKRQHYFYKQQFIATKWTDPNVILFDPSPFIIPCVPHTIGPSAAGRSTNILYVLSLYFQLKFTSCCATFTNGQWQTSVMVVVVRKKRSANENWADAKHVYEAVSDLHVLCPNRVREYLDDYEVLYKQKIHLPWMQGQYIFPPPPAPGEWKYSGQSHYHDFRLDFTNNPIAVHFASEGYLDVIDSTFYCMVVADMNKFGDPEQGIWSVLGTCEMLYFN